MQTLDFLILGAFFVYVLYSGFSNSKVAGKNLEEYFLAGRTLPGWQAGISMAATQFAADTPLLVTGIVAMYGVFPLWRLWVYALSFLVIGFLLAPCWQRAGILTDAELVERRYSGAGAIWLRVFKAIYLGTLFNMVVLAMVLLAGTNITEALLPWHEMLPEWLYQPIYNVMDILKLPMTTRWTPADPQFVTVTTNNLISLVLLAGMTLLYSTAGGLRSVVRTDVVQFIIMIIGTAAFGVTLVLHLGGWGESIAALKATLGDMSHLNYKQLVNFTPSNWQDLSWDLMALFAVQWLAQINADGSGYLAQRFMACKNATEGTRAALLFAGIHVLVRNFLWLPIAIGLLAVYPPQLTADNNTFIAAREATYVQGMMELLPAGILGLMVTSMLAALISTLDTHLNWGSSYWTNDLYKSLICERWLKRTPKDTSLVWVARFSNLCILLGAVVFMLNFSSIQQAWQISLLFGAGLGVPLLLRWLWWRFNQWGELACLGTSLLAAPLLLMIFPGTEGDTLRMLWMVGLSVVTCLVTAYALPPEPMPMLVAFYEKHRPPGFWRPVAQESFSVSQAVENHRPLNSLRVGLMNALGTAFAMFLLLVGIAGWVYQSPLPVWLPVSWAYPAMVLSSGLVAWGLWWLNSRIFTRPEF